MLKIGQNLDCNISDKDESLNIVTINGKKIILNDDQFLNPFFVNAYDNKLDEIEKKDIYFKYKRLLILCMSNNYNNQEDNKEVKDIFNMILDRNIYNKISKYFTLIECSCTILNNKLFYKKSLIIESSYLEELNHKKIQLYDNEIVLPMFELNENSTKLYSMLFNNLDIENIPQLISLNNHYNNGYNKSTNFMLSKLLSTVKESCYWTNKKNCDITFNDYFTNRKFKNKKVKNKNNTINTVINTYNFDNMDEEKNNINVYNILNKKYYSTSKDKIIQLNSVKTYITELMIKIDNEKELFNIFNTLLISKDYCHIVLNNYTILNKMTPIINKYLPLYKYLLGYAWLTFYLEENMSGRNIKKDDRIVFDIETANLLPLFNNCDYDIFQNPYITLPVSKENLNISNNLMSLKNYKNHLNRIDDLINFKTKFNLFTTGTLNKNIFDGLKWNNKFAISGSIMAACIQQNPLLMKLLTNENMSYANRWATYFNQYYSESDIDLMVNNVSVFDFMDSVLEVKNIVQMNLQSFIVMNIIKTTAVIITEQYIDYNLNDIRNYANNNNLTKKDILNNLNDEVIKQYFYNIYINTKQKNNIKQRKLYNKDNQLYNEYYKFLHINDINIKLVDYKITESKQNKKDNETYFYINNNKNNNKNNSKKVEDNENNMIMKISESIKVKLDSIDIHKIRINILNIIKNNNNVTYNVLKDELKTKIPDYVLQDELKLALQYNMIIYYDKQYKYNYDNDNNNLIKYNELKDTYSKYNKLKHVIEIFRIPKNDFFSSVSKFHLPCVRAYYNGDNVYMLPSCITAHMTNINIDYKYIAGIRDPAEILNNYRQRNFGTVLSSKEKIHMKKLVKNNLGFKDINDNFYKVKYNKNELPLDIYNNIELEELNTLYDLDNYYRETYPNIYDTLGLDLLKFKTINDNGKINRLQKWVIDAFNDMI
jgi:hypothetical protein